MKLNTEQLFSVLVPDLRFRPMDEICCSKVYFPLPHINYYRSGGLHLKVVDTEKVSPLPLLWTIWCCMLFMAFVCSMSWLSSNTGYVSSWVVWHKSGFKGNGKHTWLKGSSIAPSHQFNCLVKCFSDCVSWLRKSHDLLLETYSGSTLLISLGYHHCYWALRRPEFVKCLPTWKCNKLSTACLQIMSLCCFKAI